MENGNKLGQWVSVQRQHREIMNSERKGKLESLPGWTWNQIEFQWEEGLSALQEFIAREGHARPSHHDRYGEGLHSLGGWVIKQRSQKGTLAPGLVARLSRLPEWIWDPLEIQWEEGFSALEEYVNKEGNAMPSQTHKEGNFRLGTWVNSQRQKVATMSPERKSRLESLAGWTWDPLEFQWEETFASLEKFIVREGHARPHPKHVEDGYKIGSWVTTRRQRKNRLSSEQISRLENLPGWSWDPRGERWPENMAALEKYVKREGSATPPPKHREDGYALATWITRQRRDREELSPEQVSRLENLPGWTWDALETQWEEGFTALERYVEREGHARPPNHFRENELGLGAWVTKQRGGKERLSRHRIARLENLPGWAWDARQSRWERAMATLEQFVEREGHARPPNGFRENEMNLGGWVSSQRSDRKLLGTEQRFRLENLPGWSWDPRSAQWEEGFTALERYVEREGHARPPTHFRENELGLGAWVSKQREAKERLSTEQISRLESLPGWTWNARAFRWEIGFLHLQRFAEKEGHARPNVKHEENGHNLGAWVYTQKGRRNNLTPEQVSRLEGLAGWDWESDEK